MSKLFSVIKTGGKQYLVKEGDEIIVDKLNKKEKENVELETLAIFDEGGEKLELGTPLLKEKTQAQVLEHLKGDKIDILRFKAKVRYRRRKGFRAKLTKIKIVKIK